MLVKLIGPELVNLFTKPIIKATSSQTLPISPVFFKGTNVLSYLGKKLTTVFYPRSYYVRIRTLISCNVMDTIRRPGRAGIRTRLSKCQPSLFLYPCAVCMPACKFFTDKIWNVITTPLRRTRIKTFFLISFSTANICCC